MPPNRLTSRCSEPGWPLSMTNSQHVYEVLPRKDHRGVNLISRCAAIRSALVRANVERNRVCDAANRCSLRLSEQAAPL